MKSASRTNMSMALSLAAIFGAAASMQTQFNAVPLEKLSNGQRRRITAGGHTHEINKVAYRLTSKNEKAHQGKKEIARRLKQMQKQGLVT